MDTQKIGRLLIYLIVGVFVLTGTFKVVGNAEAAEEFGNSTAPFVLAAVQYLIAAALLVPKTRLLGVLLAASYFGGVICFQWLNEGELPIVGIAINTVLYVGAALHYPFLRDGSVTEKA